MALPSIHSWTVFALSVALDNSLTFFELLHDEPSNIIGSFVVARKLLRYVVGLFSEHTKEKPCDVEKSAPAPARAKSIELVGDENGSVEVPSAYLELDPKFLKRIEVISINERTLKLALLHWDSGQDVWNHHVLVAHASVLLWPKSKLV